jgi:hypothetical protein
MLGVKQEWDELLAAQQPLGFSQQWGFWAWGLMRAPIAPSYLGSFTVSDAVNVYAPAQLHAFAVPTLSTVRECHYE